MAGNVTSTAINQSTLNKAFTKYEKKIVDAQKKGNSAMIDMAHGLYSLSDESFIPLLKERGYSNICDYAKQVFGIEKTSVYDGIRVMKLFGTPTGSIITGMAEYTFSQLKKLAIVAEPKKDGTYFVPEFNQESSMDGILQAIHEIFPSTMSVRDIDAKIKSYKKALIVDKESDNECSTEDEPIDIPFAEQEPNDMLGAASGDEITDTLKGTSPSSTPIVWDMILTDEDWEDELNKRMGELWQILKDRGEISIMISAR